MDKKASVKKMIAGIFCVVGILFAVYISMIILKGNVTLSLLGLIIGSLGVYIPVCIGTFIFISSTNENYKRCRIMKAFVLVVFGFYGVLLLNMLFLSGSRQFKAVSTINITEYIKWNSNFIPFKTISEYIHRYNNNSINKSIVIKNIIGNIVVFAPMGILLPCIFTFLRKFKNFLIVMLVALIGIEIVQMITKVGSCDIDDVILNLSGALLLYGFWNLNFVQRILRKIYVLN